MREVNKGVLKEVDVSLFGEVGFGMRKWAKHYAFGGVRSTPLPNKAMGAIDVLRLKQAQTIWNFSASPKSGLISVTPYVQIIVIFTVLSE